MLKKQLVSSGVILALLSSNIIIGHSYISDSKKYEITINNQNKIIKQSKMSIEKQVKQLNGNKSVINELHEQENKLQSEVDSVKKENENIKKELVNRKEVKKSRQLNMELTFYVANCRGCSGVTKTGIDVTHTTYYKGYRVIASDPRVIPLHSIVKIQTEKGSYLAYAADTGGEIKGNLLDVLVSNESEALRLGRKKAVITIIRNGG